MARIKISSDGRESIKPRAVQLQAVEFLERNWGEARVLALQMPVGAGKSWVARALQRAVPNSAIITPSNILVEQYKDVYADVNRLIGRAHYSCHVMHGLQCDTVYDSGVFESKGYCPGCKYISSKIKARKGEPTLFNPMSWLYLEEREEFKTLIVDEAHSLLSMLQMLSGFKFWRSKHGFPKTLNELDLLAWFEVLQPRLLKQKAQYAAAMLASSGKEQKAFADKLNEFTDTVRAIDDIKQGLKEEPQSFAVWSEEADLRGSKDEALNIKPVRVPRHIVRRFFKGVENIVLMSGTLLDHDLKDLVGNMSVAFLDLSSPIPKEQRLVHYAPLPYDVNTNTTPHVLAKSILKTCEQNPGNTIIHVSYAWSKKLAPFMPPNIIINEKHNTDKKIKEFKEKGGIFLAAACAEGVDLKGDLCRVNIIPILNSPSIGDPVVIKRKALADGQSWYDLETMKVTIQQAGRSTRSEDDYSKTIILAPRFKQVFKATQHKLPASFVEAVRGV